MPGGRLRDGPVGRQIDAEGLLAQQVLSRIEDVDVQLLVEVVRDRAIHGVHVAALQELQMVFHGTLNRRNVPLKPCRGIRIHVADRGDFGLEPEVSTQMQEPGRGAGELPTHEPAADDAEAHLLRGAAAGRRCTAAAHRCDAAFSGVAFS